METAAVWIINERLLSTQLYRTSVLEKKIATWTKNMNKTSENDACFPQSWAVLHTTCRVAEGEGGLWGIGMCGPVEWKDICFSAPTEILMELHIWTIWHRAEWPVDQIYHMTDAFIQQRRSDGRKVDRAWTKRLRLGWKENERRREQKRQQREKSRWRWKIVRKE